MGVGSARQHAEVMEDREDQPAKKKMRGEQLCLVTESNITE